MFSQYSWWDFAKVVILLAIPYYGFVAWKYYREDIMDWFSNKGAKDQAASAPASDEDDDDEVDTSELYSVKNYSNDNPSPAIVSEPVQQMAPQSAVVEEVPEPEPVTQAESVDVDISEGVVVSEQPNNTFELGLTSTSIRPAERSLSEAINAAKRMKADDQGKFTPYNPDDAEASELAGTLNQQKGIGSVLDGVAFTR